MHSTLNKLFVLLFCLVSALTFAQNPANSIKGKYYSEQQRSNLMLNMGEDNKYELSVFFGNYEMNNDSIIFNLDAKKSPFDFKYLSPEPNSKRIKLSFSGTTISYYTNKIHVGTLSVADSVNYKSLNDYLSLTEDSVLANQDYSFEIDRNSYFYLASDADTTTILEKYKIPSSVSEIRISYNPYPLDKLSLKGFVDRTTNQITITDGHEPVLFSLKKDSELKNDLIEPVEHKSLKNWSYPGKRVVESSDYDGVVDSAYVTPDEKPLYTFNLNVQENLKDALAIAKSQKEKILVVVYNPTVQAATPEFKSFIESFQTELQYSMNEGYVAEIDRFTFYFAPQKDKSAVRKYGVDTEPAIIFLNSNETVLYHASDTDLNNFFAYNNYSSIYSELLPLNAKAQLETLLNNPQSKSVDFINALSRICKIEIPYEEEVASADTEEVASVDDESDTAVVESAYEPYDYSLLKVKDNMFKVKFTEDNLNLKWTQILKEKLSTPVLDTALVEIATKELTNSGFTQIIFKKSRQNLSETDFLTLDYLLKDYTAILSIVDPSDNYNIYPQYTLNSAISEPLNRELSADNHPTEAQAKRVIEYYKKFITATNNNAEVTKSYLDALQLAGFSNEFLAAYEVFYKSIIQDNSSVIEQLDNAFKLNIEDSNWTLFKYEFANRANNAAWYIVEHHIANSLMIKRAILWSETSLKIDKDNIYYLDTLAQLYYKDGQEEKAIKTEQMAIDKANTETNSETLETMKLTVEKMKTRKY